jgi:hypothetical protein
MVQFVASIAKEYGVTIGMEIDPAEPNPNLEIAVDEATLEDVLNSVTEDYDVESNHLQDRS